MLLPLDIVFKCVSVLVFVPVLSEGGKSSAAEGKYHDGGEGRKLVYEPQAERLPQFSKETSTNSKRKYGDPGTNSYVNYILQERQKQRTLTNDEWHKQENNFNKILNALLEIRRNQQRQKDTQRDHATDAHVATDQWATRIGGYHPAEYAYEIKLHSQPQDNFYFYRNNFEESTTDTDQHSQQFPVHYASLRVNTPANQVKPSTPQQVPNMHIFEKYRQYQIHPEQSSSHDAYLFPISNHQFKQNVQGISAHQPSQQSEKSHNQPQFQQTSQFSGPSDLSIYLKPQSLLPQHTDTHPNRFQKGPIYQTLLSHFPPQSSSTGARLPTPTASRPPRLAPKINRFGFSLPQNKKLLILDWYNQRNLERLQHRQDSVDQGVAFDYDNNDDEKDNPEGVLHTNAIWPDVIEGFSHQVIPIIHNDQVNDTFSAKLKDADKKVYDGRDHSALEKQAGRFPYNTREEVFGAKIFKDLDNPRNLTETRNRNASHESSRKMQQRTFQPNQVQSTKGSTGKSNPRKNTHRKVAQDKNPKRRARMYEYSMEPTTLPRKGNESVFRRGSTKPTDDENELNSGETQKAIVRAIVQKQLKLHLVPNFGKPVREAFGKTYFLFAEKLNVEGVQLITENVAGQIAVLGGFCHSLFWNTFLRQCPILEIGPSISERMVTYKDHHVKGGTLIQIGINEKQCSELCLRNPYCLAFDYNALHSHCWFHSGSSYCGALQRRVGCNHYKRIPCVAGQCLT